MNKTSNYSEKITYEPWHRSKMENALNCANYNTAFCNSPLKNEAFEYTTVLHLRFRNTDLYYYGARYYAAWICRFISTDPEFMQRSWLNPYNYVQNNPINKIDPDGRLDEEVLQKKRKL